MSILVEIILTGVLFVIGGAAWWFGNLVHPLAAFVLAYAATVLVLVITKHVLNFFSKGTLPDGRHLGQILGAQKGKAKRKVQRK